MRGRILTFLLVALLIAACHSGEPEWTDLRRGHKDCILVVFTMDASNKDIDELLMQQLHTPNVPGYGEALRTGVAALVKRGLQGHVAYDVCFSETATSEQKSTIQQDLQSSALVYKVLHNVDADERAHSKPDPGL